MFELYVVKIERFRLPLRVNAAESGVIDTKNSSTSLHNFAARKRGSRASSSLGNSPAPIEKSSRLREILSSKSVGEIQAFYPE
jgi:hypothetical protein